MMQFKIVCASGVLVWGSSSDFLLCVAKARALKREWATNLPLSTLRVQLLYPNRKRVPSADIKAALRALENKAIANAIGQRFAAAVAIPPARSEARTAGIAMESVLNFGLDVGSVFCQAGVVAPPDSPDLGNLVNSQTGQLVG